MGADLHCFDSPSFIYHVCAVTHRGSAADTVGCTHACTHTDTDRLQASLLWVKAASNVLLGGYLSTKQGYHVSPWLYIFLGALTSMLRISVFSSPLPISKLTHLLGEQVNVLFVASLRGVVQLYQSQRLSRDTPVLLRHKKNNTHCFKFFTNGEQKQSEKC